MAVRGCLVGDLDTVVRDCGSPRATVEGIAETHHNFAGAAVFFDDDVGKSWSGSEG